VIVIDVNILIYAHNSASDTRAASKQWLEQAFPNESQSDSRELSFIPFFV